MASSYSSKRRVACDCCATTIRLDDLAAHNTSKTHLRNAELFSLTDASSAKRPRIHGPEGKFSDAADERSDPPPFAFPVPDSKELDFEGGSVLEAATNAEMRPPVPPAANNDKRDNSFYPFGSWEEAAMATLYVSGKIPRTTMDRLLRTLREPGFDSSRLPADAGQLVDKIRKLPVPKLHSLIVNIMKRDRLTKQLKPVDTKEMFYFDVEETIARVLADPELRKSLDLSPLPAEPLSSQSNMRDTAFAADPARFSTLQTFSFRDSSFDLQHCSIGDFVVDKADRPVMITRLEAAPTSLRVVGELWQRQRSELRRAKHPRTVTVETKDLTAKLTVLPRDDFDMLPSAEQKKVRACWTAADLGNVRGQLLKVAELPYLHKSGKHLWLKLYLDDFALYRSLANGQVRRPVLHSWQPALF